MNKAWIVALLPGLAAVILVVMILGLLLVKLVWSWTIPDLFPGAVAQGLVARDISWYTAFKVAIFAALLAGIAGARRRGES
jgi:hypothetical protein